MKRRHFLRTIGISTAAVATGIAAVPLNEPLKVIIGTDPAMPHAEPTWWIKHEEWLFEQRFRTRQEQEMFKFMYAQYPKIPEESFEKE